MEHRYSVFGVSVTSDVPFEFRRDEQPRAGGAAVEFTCAEDGDLPSEETHASDWFTCDERPDGSVYLRWGRYFDFLVEGGGTRIKYRALEDGDTDVLQNFLFGQALSVALVQQGVEPLHAAVIEVDGRGIALLGDCGYGKSTLAAAFVQAGSRLVSDDVLVVYRERGRVMAAAGSGRVKLLPDSASAVLRAKSPGVPITARAEKRVFRLDESMLQRCDVPLDAVFVLPSPDVRDRTAEVAIAPIAPTRLFHELVKNTFVTPLAGASRLERNFDWNARLAADVRGFCVSYPSGIAKLPAVRDIILEHRRHRSTEDTQ